MLLRELGVHSYIQYVWIKACSSSSSSHAIYHSWHCVCTRITTNIMSAPAWQCQVSQQQQERRRRFEISMRFCALFSCLFWPHFLKDNNDDDDEGKRRAFYSSNRCVREKYCRNNENISLWQPAERLSSFFVPFLRWKVVFCFEGENYDELAPVREREVYFKCLFLVLMKVKAGQTKTTKCTDICTHTKPLSSFFANDKRWREL